MKRFSKLLTAFVGTMLCAELDEGVLVLTDDNFDEELAKHPNILVEFYAPWCGHCKKLAPEYASAAQALAEQDPPLPLGKVDATEQKKISEKFGVQGFPTLLWFNNGVKQEYTGGRTKDTIISWVTKKSGPPSLAADCDTVKAKVAANKFVIAFFGAESHDQFKVVHEPVASAEDKITFVHTADAECAAHYGVAAGASIFFRTFETEKNVYAGAAELDAFNAWFKPMMVPTLFKFTEEEIEAVFGQQQNTAILFRGEDDAETAWSKAYEAASKSSKGKLLFSFSDGSVSIQEKLAEFMGVDKTPVLMAIKPEAMLKYRYNGGDLVDATQESIDKWVESVVDGSAEPHLKSEAIPEDHEGVQVIVGKNFHARVMDSTKDVFVKYYAPWCGHCKKLAPIWDELAEAYKASSDLVIAKFDATTNEAEGVNVKGYPTLIFYPKGGSEPVTYDGDRDLEGFKKWLDQNAESVNAVADAVEDAVKEDL